jgi:hypothetical protein
MSKYDLDVVDRKIHAKKKIADGMFDLIYKTRHEREKNAEFIQEVYDQIEVCEGMMCPISVEKIIEWVTSKNIGKVRTEARTIKFAS